MEKGCVTVSDFLRSFNWTDVDFEIFKITYISFSNNIMSADYDRVFDSKKDNWDNIHQFDNMKIGNIDGYCYKDIDEYRPVLQLLEDDMQYGKIAKQSDNWEYIP